MTKTDRQIQRRNLLVGMSLAAPALAIPKEASASDASASDTVDDDVRTVRLADSPHIRTYYDLARR